MSHSRNKEKTNSKNDKGKLGIRCSHKKSTNPFLEKQSLDIYLHVFINSVHSLFCHICGPHLMVLRAKGTNRECWMLNPG